MAQQTVNIGAAPDDGTGDPLRTAFDAINDNFNELYAADLATPEAVRDMLATALVAGAAVTITPNDGADTLTIAIDTSGINELARDALGAALTAGVGITITPSDAGDTITITCSLTQYTDELAQDAVGAILLNTATIDFAYDDTTPNISASVVDGGITLAKQASVATGTVFYRKTAGTGAPEVQTLATLKTDLALGNVDNTSDANKPVSIAQQAALDLKAPLDSPSFTNNPSAPTQAGGDDSTKLATTAFVKSTLAVLTSGASAAYDTFLELQNLMQADDTAFTALTATVAGKLQKDQNLSDLPNAATARANLSLTVGTNVQAWSTILDSAVLGQLQFPATQNPSADANTLDDYEEGTFTPALKFGGASVGMTYATQDGRYTKIGRQVFVQIDISLSAKGSSTGNATITGLPFTAASGNNAAVLSWMLIDAATIGSLMPEISAAGAVVNLYNWSSSALSFVTEANINNALVMRLSGSFTV